MIDNNIQFVTIFISVGALLISIFSLIFSLYKNKQITKRYREDKILDLIKKELKVTKFMRDLGSSESHFCVNTVLQIASKVESSEQLYCNLKNIEYDKELQKIIDYLSREEQENVPISKQTEIISIIKKKLRKLSGTYK